IIVSLFFFSSRRRHTRFSRDWSSDVCSSDLDPLESRLVERSRAELSEQKETLSVVQRYAYYHEDVLFSAIQRIIGESLEQPPGRSEERRVGKECRSR